MKPVDPEGLPGVPTTFAENQPQYRELPSTYDNGDVWSRWELTVEERQALIDGAGIELCLSTFGQPLQPIRLRVQGIEEKSHVREDDPDS